MNITLPKFGKTFIGGVGIMCAAYLKFDAGDLSGAITLFAEGLAVIGIGHKIEKQDDK